MIPEKKPKADKESARSGTKRQQEVYATIDKSYEDMKGSKHVTEDSALVIMFPADSRSFWRNTDCAECAITI